MFFFVCFFIVLQIYIIPIHVFVIVTVFITIPALYAHMYPLVCRSKLFPSSKNMYYVFLQCTYGSPFRLSHIQWTLPPVKRQLNFFVIFRTPADPTSALQRSRSSFQLEESREGDSSKDFPWRRDTQEMLGSMQDTSFNRSESFNSSESLHRSEFSGNHRSVSFRRSESDHNTLSPPTGQIPPTGQRHPEGQS